MLKMCFWNFKITNNVEHIYLYSICIRIQNYHSEIILYCKAYLQQACGGAGKVSCFLWWKLGSKRLTYFTCIVLLLVNGNKW